MNPLAEELNSQLGPTVAGRLLSRMGSRLYFPKGIIAQSAEAKKSAHAANATIGMAYNCGKPLILPIVAESMPTLNAEQIVAYAPTAGVEQVRNSWQDHILEKNPALKRGQFSLPVVVPGLTSGLSDIADLFLDKDSVIISSEPCWDNYSLIFEERRAGKIRGVPFFGNGPELDVDAIGRAVMEEAQKGQVRVILNFPNNPAGYSPSNSEASALAKVFKDAAESGADVLIICDDAYFGLHYENDIYPESMFSLLAGLHEKILAVKIDGPIKEDYVWGLRVGFVSFGCKGLGAEHYSALITKLMGAIRSSVSCVNTPSQHIIMKILEDSRTEPEKAAFMEIMRKRYNSIRGFISANPNHPALKPLPFNSGYFMSFLCNGISAEALRKELLSEHGIGTISLGDKCLRIAYSSLDEDQIRAVYSIIYDCAAKMSV